jgi:hypothetical protein
MPPSGVMQRRYSARAAGFEPRSYGELGLASWYEASFVRCRPLRNVQILLTNPASSIASPHSGSA